MSQQASDPEPANMSSLGADQLACAFNGTVRWRHQDCEFNQLITVQLTT